MPIYEYRCSACEHVFEEWQKIADPPVETCPSCGEKKAEKVISSTTFLLKGGGWYATDYGGKKAHGGKVSEKAQKADAERSAKRDAELKAEKAKSEATSAPSISTKKD